MKKINTIYWILTGLIAAFMAFSAIPDIMMVPDAIELVSNHLGYPEYFLAYIGVAKLLGAIVLVVPGYPRLKEWAYAGLFFDLFSAAYSMISVHDPIEGVLFFPIPIGILFASYIYHHKRLDAKRIQVHA